jgi:hypothetical protein
MLSLRDLHDRMFFILLKKSIEPDANELIERRCSSPMRRKRVSPHGEKYMDRILKLCLACSCQDMAMLTGA